MSDASSAADGDNLLFRLPPELLGMVLQDLRTSGADGVSALATLASTCKMLNKHVTPVLYSRLVLTRRNAAHLFLGLPRAAPAKKVTRTKSEWDAQLAEFAEKYDDWFGEWEDMSDDEDEDMTPSELEVYSDSDPETDDEYAPDLKTVKEETVCTTWVRRLELFKWTTRLDIVQVPTCAISTDLVRATKPWLHQSDWEKKQGYPPPESSSSDAGASSTILFPNLERLSLSARAVRYLGGKRLFADESSWGVYEWMSKEAVPFMFVLSHTLGTPAHVCVTSTHERVDRTAEHAFRRIRRPAETIEERHVEYAIRVDNKHQESGRRMFEVLQALSFMRGDNLRSLTVHGIRHALSLRPGFEDEEQGTALPYMEAWEAPHLLTYRYMYLPGRRTGDTVERRVAAIMSNALGTAPWLPDSVTRVEHVGVGNAVRFEDSGDEGQDGDEPPMDPDEAAAMVVAGFAEQVKDSLPARFRLDEGLETNEPLSEDNDPALQAAYETAQATADEARVEFMTQAVPAALVDVNARLEQVRAEIKAQRDSPNGVDAATRAKEVKLRAEASRLAIVVAQEAREARLVAETNEKTAKAASRAADTVMFGNRNKRVAARYPSPLDRVVFTPTAAEAAPCVVCGGKDHGDGWTLAELLEHSYN